jgi:hypothetical protein
MDYILGGIRFKTKPETEQNGKIIVEMIAEGQVVDTLKIHSGMSSRDEINQICNSISKLPCTIKYHRF